MSSTQPTFDDIMRLFQENAEQSNQRSREIDRKFTEIAEQSKQTDRKIKEVTVSIGRLGNRLGEFIEEAVRPAAVRLFRERGIVVHEVYQNVIIERDGEGLEFDLLVVNDQDAVGVECKSNLRMDDVNEHLERLTKLKRLSPKYANYRLMGAVAAMVIPENVARHAIAQGLFLIGQSGDHLNIRNDAGFVPISMKTPSTGRIS